MKKILKTTIFVFLFCFAYTSSNGQTPYDDFAPHINDKVMLKLSNISYRAENNDTLSKIRFVEFDSESFLLKYIDKSGKVLTQNYLKPTDFKWFSVDPHATKYANLSPYCYVANMPTRAIDPDGKDIYILFYTTGNGRGDEMFKAAALTRQKDIEKSKTFNSKKDKVIVMGISDMASIAKNVENIVDNYSPKYGKTAEFGMWSHAGTDGPTGTVATSDNRLDGKQMTLEGWSQIGFNWINNGEGAKAGFYGCKTGVASEGNSSFVTDVSALNNFRNVSVYGQTSSAYPSKYTDYRMNSDIGDGNFILKEKNGIIYYFPTYMVGGIGRSKDWDLNEQNVALPMRVSKNGIGIVSGFQPGATH